ncbi:MAG: type III pantothenate kinase [Gammaproteobacteria bacterium]|nr:type III pantothenate kinase [Gammaproteobacteria bacterium]
MRLLIDAGNSRIKWARVVEKKWVETGMLPVKDVQDFLSAMSDINEIGEIWVSNVAGDEVARQISKLGKEKTRFISAKKKECGVTNNYSETAQLGSDRWAALIAAWNKVHRKCLVVNCGTATTIDALSDNGEFTGGLILPGIILMQSSLINATKNIKSDQGYYAEFPQNTADALLSGSIQATCGAIQRQHALLKSKDVDVILSGGSAPVLNKHLELSFRYVEHLVLNGMELIAEKAGEE